MQQLTQADLVAALKRNVRPSKQEQLSDVEIGEFLEEAVRLHNGAYVCTSQTCTVPPNEERAIVLLAWHSITLARVSFYASQVNSVKAGEFSTTQSPGKALIELSNQLKAMYAEECARLGLTSFAGRGPVQMIAAAAVPYSPDVSRAPLLAGELPDTFVLSASREEASVVILQMDVAVHPRFIRWHLVQKDGDDAIFQDWNTESLTGVPCLHDNATIVKVSTLPVLRAFRLTGLDSQTTYRFLVVQEVEGPLYSYSNELLVAPPEDPPT